MNLFWLFCCTCIRTVRVRKLFTTFLILKKFHVIKCNFVVFVSYKQILNYFVLRAVLFYTTSSKDFLSLLEVDWKNIMCAEIPLR